MSAKFKKNDNVFYKITNNNNNSYIAAKILNETNGKYKISLGNDIFTKTNVNENELLDPDLNIDEKVSFVFQGKKFYGNIKKINEDNTYFITSPVGDNYDKIPFTSLTIVHEFVDEPTTKENKSQTQEARFYVTVNHDGTYSVSKTYIDGVIAVEKNTNNEFYVIES